MLYKNNQLQQLSTNDSKTALRRYLHKFRLHRNEIKKLKAHEKQFLFLEMSTLTNNDKKAFDLSQISEASDYYFNLLILIYSENLNFDKPIKNHLGNIIGAQEMEHDKNYFNKKYIQWKTQLETHNGKYFSVIYPELNQKLKELRSMYDSNEITETDYHYQIKNLYSMSFFIYYKVKLFFDELTDKFILLKALGGDIIINIYSFVHILFRHYIPSLDIKKTDRSINKEMPFLDIENLPLSIKDFLIIYFNYDKSALTKSREYILFSFKNNKYIIWIKYSNSQFELRTLYLCEHQRDLDKFKNLTEHKASEYLSFYF